MDKTIVSSVSISTIEDGQSAPYYFQEWFAWSSDPSTDSVTTEPTIGGTWATFIPAQGSYAYLWRKSIRYVWNENTRQYTAETPQYFRMSGTNGTSIHTRGQVANASSRGTGTATIITDSGTETITMSDGDAVTQLDDGHLYQWVTEGGGKWLDLGQFKGESGVTYYTHVVWAENIIIPTNPRRPLTIVGYLPDKPASDTTHNWMGVHVDQDPLDPVSDTDTVLLEYTWSNTKGNKGDKGDKGDRGKVGRFFYFGGTFNAADTTQTFIVNDAQAPYFEHSETVTTQSGTKTIKRYHVFNYETNGSYTMAQMWSISSQSWNNAPWEVMTNDFKYIITEALFSKLAKLGSFVISGDWMLSTNGKINGTDYNDGAMYNGAPAYTWFDPAYPNVDHTKTVTIGGQQVTVHNFIPNFCVDGLTGETYQNKAVVRGVINATAIYQKYQNDIVQEETVDPSKGSAIVIPNSYIGNNIYLPSASSYDYLTLTFYRYFPASTMQTIARICASGNDLIYTNTELKPTVGQYRTYCKSFYPAHNLVIKLHSIGGQWCLDCDESKLLAFYDENGNKLEVVER